MMAPLPRRMRPGHPVVTVVCVLLALSLSPVQSANAAEAPWVGEELSGAPCHGGGTGYGPYDYTNPIHFREKLPIVEAHHFTPKVAALEAGQGGALLPDIDYTLRAFPNHHGALFAIIRLYSQKPRREGLDAWRTPPECYLQRALHFAPGDDRLYLLYGIYLHRVGDLGRAEAMYRKALELDPGSAETHYNLGLLLVDRGQYKEARAHAREAYAKGYPLPGLRNSLADAGYPL